MAPLCTDRLDCTMSMNGDVVEILVRGLAGDVVLGPQQFSRPGAVAELRTKVLKLRHSRTGIDRVQFVCDGVVLQDESVLEGERVDCMALLEHEELREDERRRCISGLCSVTAGWLGVAKLWMRSGVRPNNMGWSSELRSKALQLFSGFSDVARADAEVVKEAVRCHWQCLETAHERFREEASVVYEAFEHSEEALNLASMQLRGDKQFMLRCVRLNGKAMRFATPELCQDQHFVLEALWRNPTALRNITFEVPDDVLWPVLEDIGEAQVLESVDQDEAFRQVRADGLWLASAVEFQDDKAVVLAAVEQNCNALRFTSLVDDRDVVLKAVRCNGKMLEFASEDLRRDREVILTAIRSNPRARKFAIDVPLFDVSDSDSVAQEEATIRRPSKRAGRVRRSGRKARAVRRSCGCESCSVEP